MKVWYGYGSEHSMRLVMIGHFKEVKDAEAAKEAIDRLIAQVSADVDSGAMVIGSLMDRYSEGMTELLMKDQTYNIAPAELEQFGYDIGVELKRDKVIVTTDESDISAFLKVLINHEARVEVYSHHHYPPAKKDQGQAPQSE